MRYVHELTPTAIIEREARYHESHTLMKSTAIPDQSRRTAARRQNYEIATHSYVVAWQLLIDNTNEHAPILSVAERQRAHRARSFVRTLEQPLTAAL